MPLEQYPAFLLFLPKSRPELKWLVAEYHLKISTFKGNLHVSSSKEDNALPEILTILFKKVGGHSYREEFALDVNIFFSFKVASILKRIQLLK